uniref:Secreted protein n=1 Tax=Astatotilapia calliptera TaxID=8154 RepID=A0A3P8NKC4_ASTCA
MLSMLSPFSSFFSISTISLTPSTTSWTCSTSEEPRRSALEMSNTPPTEAVSTPPKEKGQKSESQWRFHWAVQAGPQAYECLPVPRFCRRSLVRISSNLGCVLSLDSLTWTPPRRPVPRLEGQVRMYPRCSFHMKPRLCFLKISSIWQV